MLRFLGFATLILVAVCLALGASIALAADGAPALSARAVEADEPSIEDVYEFDFAVTFNIEPHPEFDEPSGLLDI